MKKEFELYEIIYLVKPNFTQQEVAAKSEYYQNFLTKQGSQVLAQNKGKRTLSYPIKGFESAHYIQMVYHGNKTLINSLRQELKRDETILREINVRLEKGNNLTIEN